MHGVFARQGEREFMLSMLEDILGSISGMSSCAYAKTSLYTWDIDLVSSLVMLASILIVQEGSSA